MTLLRASDRNQQKWEVVLAALELDFHQEEAERRLETAITWPVCRTVELR